MSSNQSQSSKQNSNANYLQKYTNNHLQRYFNNEDNHCILCAHDSSQLILWLRQNQYRKQNNFQVRHIKVINHILSKPNTHAYINYKEAVMGSSEVIVLDSLSYKDWEQIVSEIRKSIWRNLQVHKGQKYNKMYHSEIMLKNQNKKKISRIRKFKQQFKSSNLGSTKQNALKINSMTMGRLSMIPSDQRQKLLQNQQLRTCYDFYPVEVYEKQNFNRKLQKQRDMYQSFTGIQQSQMYLQKLKNQLSMMISQMKEVNQSPSLAYSQVKFIGFSRPFLNDYQSKQEIRFRTKLAANFSDIIQIDSMHNKNEKKKLQYQTQINGTNVIKHKHTHKINNKNHQMYTSPDFENENKCMEMYGCLVQKESEAKGIKKSKNKKQVKKIISNNVKLNNVISHNQKCRQMTEPWVSQLGASSTTVSGASLTNRKSKSKSKLKVKPSLSPSTNTLTMCISSPRGHNSNSSNMNENSNNMNKLKDVRSKSRDKLRDKSKSVNKTATKR